jgi:IS5 family transposase
MGIEWRKPRDYRQADLFGPSLEQIIDMRHPLVRLASEFDGISSTSASARSTRRETDSRRCRCGWWPVSSSSSTCIRSASLVRALGREPVFSVFRERVFRHELAFDRSSLTR